MVGLCYGPKSIPSSIFNLEGRTTDGEAATNLSSSYTYFLNPAPDHPATPGMTQAGGYGYYWNLYTSNNTFTGNTPGSQKGYPKVQPGVYMHQAEAQRLTLNDCRYKVPNTVFEMYEDHLLTVTLGRKYNASSHLDTSMADHTERSIIHTGPTSTSFDDFAAYSPSYPGSKDKRVYVASDSFVNFSDGRMKWHEQPIGDGLDVVRRLTPKTYCMGAEILTPEREAELERGPRRAPLAGVIAQEVQDVVPGAVHGSEPMSVDYQQLFVYAMAAVKELDATVTELKTARASQALVIQSLLSRVAALEGI